MIKSVITKNRRCVFVTCQCNQLLWSPDFNLHQLLAWETCIFWLGNHFFKLPCSQLSSGQKLPSFTKNRLQHNICYCTDKGLNIVMNNHLCLRTPLFTTPPNIAWKGGETLLQTIMTGLWRYFESIIEKIYHVS